MQSICNYTEETQALSRRVHKVRDLDKERWNDPGDSKPLKKNLKFGPNRELLRSGGTFRAGNTISIQFIKLPALKGFRMLCRRCLQLLLLTVSGLGLGCGASKSDYKDLASVQANAPKQHDHATHEGAHLHYGAGPHGGTLLELGGDDFHAELVFDHDSHAIRIFLYGGDAKTPLPSRAPHAKLVLDKDRTITLRSLPLEGESNGMSSRFELIDENLVHEILEKGFLHGDLEVEIAGKSFKSHLDIHLGNEKHEHKDGAGNPKEQQPVSSTGSK